MRRLGGRKGKEEMMNYIIISKKDILKKVGVMVCGCIPGTGEVETEEDPWKPLVNQPSLPRESSRQMRGAMLVTLTLTWHAGIIREKGASPGKIPPNIGL